MRERGAEPLTIYINFDGGDMTLGEEDDAHTDTTQIEALVGPFPALEATEKFKFEIVDAVRRDWSTLGVVVVAERPPPTREYVMCMVGPREFPDATSVLGIAPVDCSDSHPRNVAFSFTSGTADAQKEATIISHEVAHTLGLEHHRREGGIMYPTLSGTGDNEFIDNCQPIDVLPDAEIVCPTEHAAQCNNDSTRQDSLAELDALLGDRPLDDTPPTASIVRPQPGQEFLGVEPVDFLVEALDNLTVEKVEFYLDGELVGTAYTRPFELSHPVSFAGVHVLYARVSDPYSNTVQTDKVEFSVEMGSLDHSGGGDGGPGGDPDGESGDGGNTTGGESGGSVVVPQGGGLGNLGGLGKTPSNVSSRSDGCGMVRRPDSFAGSMFLLVSVLLPGMARLRRR